MSAGWSACGGASSAWLRLEVGLPGGAAEEGFDADEQDVEVEGLGEVVVGAGFDAFEDVFGAGAGGEHQDGGVAPASRRARAMAKPSVPGSMQSRTMTACGLVAGGARS